MLLFSFPLISRLPYQRDFSVHRAKLSIISVQSLFATTALITKRRDSTLWSCPFTWVELSNRKTETDGTNPNISSGFHPCPSKGFICHDRHWSELGQNESNFHSPMVTTRDQSRWMHSARCTPCRPHIPGTSAKRKFPSARTPQMPSQSAVHKSAALLGSSHNLLTLIFF